jgi:inner membrane protein
MDSVTQAALGAAIGEATLGKKIGSKGALYGALVATVPDLDVILLPFFDDIQSLAVHRGFSHSILFSFIGALFFVWFFNKFKTTAALTNTRLFIFSWLALVTHMLLDAFTSYGTQLFLPFSNERVSFDSVCIVDPAYTLLLITGVSVAVGMRKRNKTSWQFNAMGLVLSTMYLFAGLGVKSKVEDFVKAELKEKQIAYTAIRSIPIAAGISEWYCLAHDDDKLYLAKYSELMEGKDFESFPIQNSLLDQVGPELGEAMRWFAQDFFTVQEEADGQLLFYNLQCDMQGPRSVDGVRVPTAFYFRIDAQAEESMLSTGFHDVPQDQDLPAHSE